MKRLLIALAVFTTLIALRDADTNTRRDKLSEYEFFDGPLKNLTPKPNVFPYLLNTPLFSNYAEKSRFIYLPPGGKMRYDDSTAFDFPNGTILIKNFYFPLDFRNPRKGRRILETRLLTKLEGGWEAWPYIWNEEQTEAYYDPAGETKVVNYIDASGKKRSTPYAIPNKNQCKGCHISDQKLLPIGPTARQLNRDVLVGQGNKNQLMHWQDQQLLLDLPEHARVPQLVMWDNSDADLNDRARAYLDANCGHCHSPKGPANTSGLFLDIYQHDVTKLGVRKTPVAAGRGAGDLQFDIVPGHPQQSIMVFRMRTNDPAVSMPEIGREQVHDEGVALIEEWIRKYHF